MHSACRLATLLVVGLAPVNSWAGEPLPRSVLIFDQSEPNSPWGSVFRAAFRSSLSAASAEPIAVYVETLDLGRFKGPQYEEPLRTFLREKYRGKPIGVIVPLGSAALKLLLRLRGELWSGVPVIFAAVDEAAATQSILPPEVTGSILRLPLRNAVVAARSLVPGLKRIALVGAPFERQPYFSHFKQELQDFRGDLEFVDLLGLPMEELRARVAALPDDAAIFYTAIYVDGAGITYVPREALRAVAEAANQPIVINAEPQIEYGGTGGFVALADPVGQDAARRASRILKGERASDIPITMGDFARPVFDWRQLQRFGIDEKRLPRGSEIRFRPPSMWEQYRTPVMTALAVVLLQSAMIAWLLFERNRRRVAELESRRRLMEIAHMNRSATAGALSASIAHELNQPLGAILSNTEAAEMLLAQDPPSIDVVKEILADVRNADLRAGEIISRLRGLLTRAEFNLQNMDLNEAIHSVVQILGAEAKERSVVLTADQGQRALLVRGEPVHVQQVLLNLAMNGMDAMLNCVPGNRRLAFETALNGESEVEVSVTDTGTGIPKDKLKSIFDPFVTTKQKGMGLGLSIVRTIVETYGGRIWAENRIGGGAVFRFTLPLAKARPA